MKLFDLGAVLPLVQKVPEALPDNGLFIICDTTEVEGLAARFDWDAGTANECVNLDETVRYTSYDGYDFISLIHLDIDDTTVTQREINLFISSRYLVLVLPARPGARLNDLYTAACRFAEADDGKPGKLMRLYYHIINRLTVDFNDTLELLEDELETLSEEVTRAPKQHQLDEIGRLRKTAYTAKKILRASSYIGEDILIDENGLLKKEVRPYFRSVNTRLKKLYDFAASLYEFSGVILSVYDSKLAIKMNELVNKLTVITLFFGPLTVITGIYGMNFKHMPELNWVIGYPLSLVVMAAISFVIYRVMKKNNWL